MQVIEKLFPSKKSKPQQFTNQKLIQPYCLTNQFPLTSQNNSNQFQTSLSNFQQNSYHQLNSKIVSIKSFIYLDDQPLTQYNLNLYFYLQFNKYIVLLLCILSLPQGIRMIIHYYDSDGFSQLGIYKPSLLLTFQKMTVGNFSNPSLINFLVSSISQLIVMIIGIIFVIKYKKFHKKIKQQIKQKLIQPKQQSVIIKGNLQILKQKDILKPQEVFETIQVRNYEQIINEIQNLKQDPTEQKLSELTKSFNQEILYYIIQFKKEKFKHNFIQICQSQQQMLISKNITIQKTIPNPHQFNWKNAKIKFSYFKIILICIIAFIFLLFTSLIINLTTIFFMQLAVLNVSLTNNNFNDQNLSKMNNFFSTVSTCVGSLVCSITNMAILILIKILLKRIRLINMQLERKFYFWIGFILVFLNTIIIPIIMTMNFDYFHPISIIAQILKIPQSNNISFSDFTRNWYVYFSPYYLNMIVIGIGNPILFSLAIIIFNEFIRYRAKKMQNKISQKKLNEMLLFFEFDIEMNFVINLVYLFIILIFAVTEPIFIILGIPLFLIHYITHKFCIIKYSKRISYCGDAINKYVIKLIPFAIWIQSFFCICVYTVPQIFPESSIYVYLNILQNGIENIQAQRIFEIFYFFVIFVVLGIYFMINLIDFSLLKKISNRYSKKYSQDDQRQLAFQDQQSNQKSNLLKSYKIYQKYTELQKYKHHFKTIHKSNYLYPKIEM